MSYILRPTYRFNVDFNRSCNYWITSLIKEALMDNLKTIRERFLEDFKEKLKSQRELPISERAVPNTPENVLNDIDELMKHFPKINNSTNNNNQEGKDASN